MRPLFLAASFVVAVCLSIMAIEAWRIMAARQTQIKEAETAATNLAKSLAEQASGTLVQADALLTGLTERLEVDGTGPANVARIRRLMQLEMFHLPQLQRLSVIDDEGRWITTDIGIPDRTTTHVDREYFRYHSVHADLAPHLGPPIRSRTSGRWIITVSRRFSGPDGRFGGIVLASISLEFFNDYFKQFDIGSNGAILLAMSDGTVLDRRPFKQDLIGKSIAGGELFRKHIAFDEGGTAWITSSIDGVERLTGFQKLHIFPAYAIVAFSKDQILREWVSDSLVHATAALLLVVILALLGGRLVSQVAQRHADQLLLVQSQAELTTLNAKLDGLAREDGLTGLPNRREFDRALRDEAKRIDRNGESLALIMLDIDRFKAYNDHFGHPQGDQCIRMVAAQIAQIVKRSGDLAARYGGEEFVILLPSTTAAGARAVAEKVRDTILRCALPHPQGVGGRVTVSMGIAVLTSRDADPTGDALLERADRALYVAKETGRDRICVHASGEAAPEPSSNAPAVAPTPRLAVAADDLPASLVTT